MSLNQQDHDKVFLMKHCSALKLKKDSSGCEHSLRVGSNVGVLWGMCCAAGRSAFPIQGCTVCSRASS